MTNAAKRNPGDVAASTGASDSTNHHEEGTMKLNSRLSDAIRVRRDNKPWANRLDHLLMRHGITTIMLARMLNISHRKAKKLRTGRRIITMTTLWGLATGLEISVATLLQELEETDPADQSTRSGKLIQRPTDYCAEPQQDEIAGV